MSNRPDEHGVGRTQPVTPASPAISPDGDSTQSPEVVQSPNRLRTRRAAAVFVMASIGANTLVVGLQSMLLIPVY
nr:hypothetical protein [Gemmatimonadaceae bacterium]